MFQRNRTDQCLSVGLVQKCSELRLTPLNSSAFSSSFEVGDYVGRSAVVKWQTNTGQRFALSRSLLRSVPCGVRTHDLFRRPILKIDSESVTGSVSSFCMHFVGRTTIVLGETICPLLGCTQLHSGIGNDALVTFLLRLVISLNLIQLRSPRWWSGLSQG